MVAAVAVESLAGLAVHAHLPALPARPRVRHLVTSLISHRLRELVSDRLRSTSDDNEIYLYLILFTAPGDKFD